MMSLEQLIGGDVESCLFKETQKEQLSLNFRLIKLRKLIRNSLCDTASAPIADTVSFLGLRNVYLLNFYS